MRKLAILSCSAVFLSVFVGFIAFTDHHDQIALKDEKFTFTPHQFYIVNVADGRSDHHPVAVLVENGRPVMVDMKGGAVDGIKNFLERNLQRDTTLRPVLLTIKELKLTEKRSATGMVSGDLKISFSFSSQQSYQNKNLVDFHKEIHYTRSMNKPAVAEHQLRSGIIDGLTYFNNFINKQGDH